MEWNVMNLFQEVDTFHFLFLNPSPLQFLQTKPRVIYWNEYLFIWLWLKLYESRSNLFPFFIISGLSLELKIDL